MKLLTSLFLAFAASPKVFAYVEKYVNFIVEALAEAKRKKAEEEFQKATDDAKKTKNTEEIDNLFNGRKKP